MNFHIPTVLLEDIEYHVSSVICSQDGIILYFNTAEGFQHAQEELTEASTFFLITSHEGCNVVGERTPYL